MGCVYNGRMMQSVEYDGKKVYYSTYGDRTKPALILLHSLMVKGSTYRSLYAYLSDSFYIIAPDLPGFGKSSAPSTNWTFSEYAHAVEKILASLKITKAVVVGHSFGGAVGMYLSFLSPTVSHLILISPSSLQYRSRSIWSILWGMMVRQTMYALLHPRHLRVFALVLRDVVYTLLMRNYTLVRLSIVLVRTVTHPLLDGFIIRVPTLLIWSHSEDVIPPEVKSEAASYGPHITIREVEGNHNWCIYHPRECAMMILQFLADCKESRREIY